MEAFKKAIKEKYYGTDESVLVKKLGKKIYISEGSIFNIKVTTKEDVQLFKRLLKQ